MHNTTLTNTTIQLSHSEREWLKHNFGTLRAALQELIEKYNEVIPIIEQFAKEIECEFEQIEIQEMKKSLQGTAIKGDLRFEKELLLNIMPSISELTKAKIENLSKAQLAVLHLMLK